MSTTPHTPRPLAGIRGCPRAEAEPHRRPGARPPFLPSPAPDPGGLR